MGDYIITALKAKKSKEVFDCNYAVICAFLSVSAYDTAQEQLSELSAIGFSNITSIKNKNAEATIATFGADLFIVFAGTDFSQIADVENNLDVFWSDEGQGKVHSGYQHHVNLLWPQIVQAIQSIPHKQIIVGGHSLGGACGQIACYRLPGSIGYFIGSACSVDKNIQKTNQSTVYHVYHRYDVVSFYPVIFGYRLLGQTHVIDKNTLILRKTKLLDVAYSLLATGWYLLSSGIDKVFGTKINAEDFVGDNHDEAVYLSDLETIAQTK